MAENNKFSLDEAFRHKLIKFIPYVELEGLTRIDSGKFGSISVAYWPKLRKKVAVKRLLMSEQDDSASKKFVHELQIQKRVEYHDNIIRILGVSQDPSNKDHLLILQYAEEGNLRNYLAQKHPTLTWNDKFKIAYGIANGLHCLHDENIVHRDLHSKNILISHGEPKIADFGISKSLNTETNLVDGVFGMIPYIEPKRLENSSHPHDKASDIYSLGTVLWEISSGKPPFESSRHDIALVVSICNGLRETPVIETPQEYSLLYQGCWSKIPQDRPDIDAIFKSLGEMIENSIKKIEGWETQQNINANSGINIDNLSELLETLDSVQYDLVIPGTSAEYVKDSALINTQESTIDIQPSQTVIRTESFRKDTETYTSALKTDTSTMHGQALKIVVVGDGTVGKTDFLTTFVYGKVDEDYVPRVYDNYAITMLINEKKLVTVGLFDTAGQEDYDRLRPLSYPHTDVFLIMFSIYSTYSLENVLKKWAPEVHFHAKDIPIYLVGNKTSIGDDKDIKRLVTYKEGLEVARKINAVDYFECSLNRDEVKKVFVQVICAEFGEEYKKKKRRPCIIS